MAKLTKKNFKDFCDKCEKKPTCITLCGLVEKYVDQDWYSFGHVDFMNIRDADNMPNFGNGEGPWESQSLETMEQKEEMIKKLLKDGMTFRKIQYYVDCSLGKIQKVSDSIKS